MSIVLYSTRRFCTEVIQHTALLDLSGALSHSSRASWPITIAVCLREGSCKGPNMSTRLRHAICQNDGGDGASPKGRCVLTQPASTDVTSVSHSTKDSTIVALLSLPKTKSKAMHALKYHPIILVKFITLCCCIHNASAGSRDLEVMPEHLTSFLIYSRKWNSYGN
jgi:hypothetical protein